MTNYSIQVNPCSYKVEVIAYCLKDIKWVDDNLESIGPEKTTVTFLDRDGKVIDKYEAYIGRQLKIPAATQIDGYVFEGWQYYYENTPDDYAQSMGFDTFEELKEN